MVLFDLKPIKIRLKKSVFNVKNALFCLKSVPNGSFVSTVSWYSFGIKLYNLITRVLSLFYTFATTWKHVLDNPGWNALSSGNKKPRAW